jgi:hypothetical protein
VALDRDGVENALSLMLARVPEADFRLVGTASSVLGGISMPAADIDTLFQDRTVIDTWVGVLSADLDTETAPTWIAESQQYFARLHADGVVVELSTVELETHLDTVECFGAGSWRHFDLVVCGPRTMPAVATELRLIGRVRQPPVRSGPFLGPSRSTASLGAGHRAERPAFRGGSVR